MIIVAVVPWERLVWERVEHSSPWTQGRNKGTFARWLPCACAHPLAPPIMHATAKKAASTGSLFAFDRVETEPRFNAVTTTVVPPPGYYSPVYDITIPASSAAIMPTSGLRMNPTVEGPKEPPQKMTQEALEFFDGSMASSFGSTFKQIKGGATFSTRMRMASHPEYLDAQINGVDKVFRPGLDDRPGPSSYSPLYPKTFQEYAYKHDRAMAFGKAAKAKKRALKKKTWKVPPTNKERLALARKQADSRPRRGSLGGGTRMSWGDKEYDLRLQSTLLRVRQHEDHVNWGVSVPPNSPRTLAEALRKAEMARQLAPFHEEGRREVNDIDRHIYRFEPQFQVYKRELSKVAQADSYQKKALERRAKLGDTLPILASDKAHSSAVIRRKPRIMASYYKSWMGLELPKPTYEPIERARKHYEREHHRELMQRKCGKKQQLKRLDDEDSDDEEYDDDLTMTLVPKIDTKNPLGVQMARMQQLEAIRAGQSTT